MPDRRTADLDASSFEAPARQASPAEPTELHVCAECGSNLVYPLDWSPTPNRRWSVVLRCPECDTTVQGVYDQPVVDRFDEELDRAAEQILDDLTRLARANMEDEVERFVGALQAGHILAEDF